MIIDPAIQAVLITVICSALFLFVQLFTKNTALEALKKHLNEALPGMLAIQFNMWKKELNGDYARKEEVTHLRSRLELECPIYERRKAYKD